jgi:hypothetical protein
MKKLEFEHKKDHLVLYKCPEGVLFVIAKKGQEFQTYSFELKNAFAGHDDLEGAEELNIADTGRLKVWMRIYRELGEFGLMDNADAPNQKWVTDVTQYRVFDTWVYLSAIKAPSTRPTTTMTCC